MFEACPVVVALDVSFIDEEELDVDMDDETFEDTWEYCLALLQTHKDIHSKT